MKKQEFIDKWLPVNLPKTDQYEFEQDVNLLSDTESKAPESLPEQITNEQFKKELERRMPDYNSIRRKTIGLTDDEADIVAKSIMWLKSELLKGGKG